MMKTRLMTLALILLSPYSVADIRTPAAKSEVSVYCASEGRGFVWHWLPDERKIKGTWYTRYLAEGGHTKLFAIKKADYVQLSEECRNNWPNQPKPRPAYNALSDWWTFIYSFIFFLIWDTSRGLSLFPIHK